MSLSCAFTASVSQKTIKGLLHSWRITLRKMHGEIITKHPWLYTRIGDECCMLLLASGCFSQPVSSIQRVQYRSKLLPCLALSSCFQGYKMTILSTFLSGLLLSNNKGTTVCLFLRDVFTVLA